MTCKHTTGLCQKSQLFPGNLKFAKILISQRSKIKKMPKFAATKCKYFTVSLIRYIMDKSIFTHSLYHGQINIYSSVISWTNQYLLILYIMDKSIFTHLLYNGQINIYSSVISSTNQYLLIRYIMDKSIFTKITAFNYHSSTGPANNISLYVHLFTTQILIPRGSIP